MKSRLQSTKLRAPKKPQLKTIRKVKNEPGKFVLNRKMKKKVKLEISSTGNEWTISDFDPKEPAISSSGRSKLSKRLMFKEDDKDPKPDTGRPRIEEYSASEDEQNEIEIDESSKLFLTTESNSD